MDGNRFGEWLRQARKARGWKQDRLAEQVNAVERGGTACTGNTISRYERGCTVPLYRRLLTLATVLDEPLTTLERLAYGTGDVHDTDDVYGVGDQRERLIRAVRVPSKADNEVLEGLRATLAGQRRLEDALGAAPVLETVQSVLRQTEAIAQGASNRIRPTIVGLVSELNQYVGWLFIPLAQPTRAASYLDRAVSAGIEANDPMRTATALSFQAYHRLRRGDARSAVALNEAAARDTAIHPGLRTYLTYQRAEVLARNGEPREARNVLDEADALVDHVPEDDLPDSGYWYTGAFFLGSRALVLAVLGERDEASQLMAESFRGMPEEWRRSEWADRRRRILDGEE